jgi:hypothetical protein
MSASNTPKLPIPGPLTLDEWYAKHYVTWDCGCWVSLDGLRTTPCRAHTTGKLQAVLENYWEELREVKRD